jgi:hypothetical protein
MLNRSLLRPGFGSSEDAAVQERPPELEPAASGLLGYLNFSDGRPDPRWQRQLDEAYVVFVQRGAARPWVALLDWLRTSLDRLHDSGGAAFRDVLQARIVFERTALVLPAYRAHHADLLAHLDDHDLFTSFFLVRVFEAVLANRDDAVDAVVTRLNDFVGHRPVAILESRPQGEPYDHERHRPVPLFLRGAGVAHGRYHDIIEKTLEILHATDADLLAESGLDLNLLDEFAVDVRAYDHSHPANRRPNYAFGEWDPHHLDNQGRFRRYVARQLTIDALLGRFAEGGDIPRDQLLFEAAAVLAGTVLMAVGVSGPTPTAHDSVTTLAVLLPRIARLRDTFYERLLSKMAGEHGERLRQERATTRQPFGGARQHVNGFLARHRAAQLQHRCLAVLFAEMGYADASRQEARRIPAASLRLLSEVLGRLSGGLVLTEQGKPAEAARLLPEVEDLLKRGIACGAFADPWNILGFQGLFPLSSAREDSVRDTRIDELVQMVEQTLNLHLHLLGEAAAVGDGALVERLTAGLRRLAAWWDRFATADVSDVHRVHGGEAVEAGTAVAEALTRWRERGEAAADLAFWRRHLDRLTTPKAFALVIDTLLRKGDYRDSSALLTTWLGRAEQVPLEESVPLAAGGLRPPHREGAYSFHTLALRWMLDVTQPTPAPGASAGAPNLIVKFFDHLEANAEDYWQAPALESTRSEEADEEEEEDLYGAAYDEFTYQDSTDDREGAVSDGGPSEPFDLEAEAEPLEKRLRFQATLARLWRIAARHLEGQEAVAGWRQAARAARQRLLTLLDDLFAHPVPAPTGDYESIVEYDRRRALKEQLLHAAVAAALDMTLAVAALEGGGPEEAEETSPPPRVGGVETLPPPTPVEPTDWRPLATQLERALFRGDAAAARRLLPAFLKRFHKETLLLTPFTEGGEPRAMLRVRLAQTTLRELLGNLPRLGLLRETFEVLRTARAMEQARPLRGRGVTEFNHFFQAAFQEIVESVVVAAADWPAEQGGDVVLVSLLERLTAPFLNLWVEHSRTLQLSVLETLQSEADWQQLQGFVRRYGSDLFHARFLTLANLRGILHRGVAAHLDYLRDNADPLHPVKLLDDLGGAVRREDAVRRLEVVLQAVVENYEEYKDYNTTTTQSDYGENLHVLLDFLRLKAAYERHAWQVRPLVLVHEVLARRGRTGAALRWQESLTNLTTSLAAQHLERLARLEKQHGARLSTVSDHLHERFVKPLALDRLCALIEPCVLETPRGRTEAFERLRRELETYTATPTGVGLDVPAWLRRLEMELHRARALHTRLGVLAEGFFRAPRRTLPFDEVQHQLGDWEQPALPG